MAVNLSPIGNGFQFFDNNGAPLNAGKIYTYQAGSSTPRIATRGRLGAARRTRYASRSARPRARASARTPPRNARPSSRGNASRTRRRPARHSRTRSSSRRRPCAPGH